MKSLLTLVTLLCFTTTYAKDVQYPDVMCQEDNDTTIHTVADKLPEFPGNIQLWCEAIMQYPKKCEKAGITGHVLVKFVVEKDGSITNIKAIKSPHEDMSKEAERMLRLMPKWKSAELNGQPVRMRMNIPIKFQLKQSKPTVNR